MTYILHAKLIHQCAIATALSISVYDVQQLEVHTTNAECCKDFPNCLPQGTDNQFLRHLFSLVQQKAYQLESLIIKW